MVWSHHNILTVTLCYNSQVAKLPLLIVKGEGPSLFSHYWLSKIKLDWCAINQITSQVYKKVVDKYLEVFKDELGTLQGTRAKIHVDPQATPKFLKSCSVPYILCEIIEKEPDCLLNEGIIEPAQFCDWAAPIVLIIKEDGRISVGITKLQSTTYLTHSKSWWPTCSIGRE